MRLKDIHHYDTYVPILAELQTRHTWNQAVATVLAALEPLGSDYCGALERGLAGRWCDRYENRGKQSGAFSAGSYDADPYILMNYQARRARSRLHPGPRGGPLDAQLLLGQAPTLHLLQLHDLRGRGGQHIQRATCSASYLLARARDDRQRALLLNRQIDAMRGTIIRQTMFAEFEKLVHASAESGEPLTIDRLTEIYRGLLKAYFGPDFVLDDELNLECLRIPHFYRAFYVYKYATGMSAAMALADRVLAGEQASPLARSGRGARGQHRSGRPAGRDGQRQQSPVNDYLRFLSGGCSKDPLDLLRDAGVDMEQPAAIDAALGQFGQLVDDLDRLL